MARSDAYGSRGTLRSMVWLLCGMRWSPRSLGWPMHPTRSSILVPILVAACGAAPVTAPPVVAAPVPRAGAPAALPPIVDDASPTERSSDQRARDDARAPLASALLSAFENDFPKLSPDGKKVLFSLNSK